MQVLATRRFRAGGGDDADLAVVEAKQKAIAGAIKRERAARRRRVCQIATGDGPLKILRPLW
jgi:hypothetical protein